MISKNENFIKLPLDEILRMNAYYEKKDKTSIRYKVFTNEQNDLVIVSRNEKGHYLYFNPNDDRDRGNIINFCKNRGIKVEELLKGKEKELEIKPIETTNSSATKALEEYKEMKAVAFNNFFFAKRLIDPYLIQEFSSLKEDKYKNINVPSFCIVKNDYQGQSIIQLTQKGYMSYLSNPLIDKENKQNKNIKSLCKGNKGLEILKTNSSKKEDIKHIIITESMIDSLSLLELKEFKTNECLVCSSNGQITNAQKEVFAYLNKEFKQAQVYLGFDNDKKGIEYTNIIQKTFENTKVLKPNFKDFNDDLFLAKILGLENNFTKQDCQKVLLSFEKNSSYLINNFHNLSVEELGKRLDKIVTKDIPKFETIKPKIQNYIDTKSLESSYSKLNQFLEKTLEHTQNFLSS